VSSKISYSVCVCVVGGRSSEARQHQRQWPICKLLRRKKKLICLADEWKTNLMSLAILFHLLCAQHVSDINVSFFRSLRLCWWITTSVVLFSVRCVLGFFAAGIWWCSFRRLKPAKRTYHHTYRCDDTRDCIIQSCPPDDEHMCSKHIEAWNKLIIKFSASSWLILRNKYIEIHGQQYIKKKYIFLRYQLHDSATSR